MDFDFFKHFKRKADAETARLQGSTDPQQAEIDDMVRLIDRAYGAKGIQVADKMVDDSDTGVSAALAQASMDRDPEMAARMAWSNPILG